MLNASICIDLCFVFNDVISQQLHVAVVRWILATKAHKPLRPGQDVIDRYKEHRRKAGASLRLVPTTRATALLKGAPPLPDAAMAALERCEYLPLEEEALSVFLDMDIAILGQPWPRK